MDEAQATLSTDDELGDGDRRRFIAARVLAHPDPTRVGEIAPLFDAEERGATVAVSRSAPDFRRPDGARTGPLASRRLSRTPFLVERRGDDLKVRREPDGPAVEINGEPMARERSFSPEAVDQGLVVLVGRNLALWIGWVETVAPAPEVTGLVGECTAMRRLRQQIHRVAALDVPVLLRGETGAGKELVAAAIHRYSRRAKGAYIAVNVAGVPASMAASELFGHLRGAFTGALKDHKGYFAQAHGGTLFLDEIGDTAGEVQALLLRVVQEGDIQPVGGSTRRVDVRLIAATDSDLENAVAERKFREPLWRRFSYEIHVPPLRARPDDIGVLFLHLVRARFAEMGDPDPISAAAARDEDAPFVPAPLVAELARCRWPGNVRELANVALSFALDNRGRTRGQASRELLRALRARRDVPSRHEPTPVPAPRKAADVPDTELIATLRAESYSTERTARRLGVSKSYLYKRLAGNSEVRRVKDIAPHEISSALAESNGQLADAAARLQISERALRLHLRRTGAA